MTSNILKRTRAENSEYAPQSEAPPFSNADRRAPHAASALHLIFWVGGGAELPPLDDADLKALAEADAEGQSNP